MSINTTETMLSEQIKRFLLPHTFNPQYVPEPP